MKLYLPGLVVLAFMTQWWLLLPVIGIVYVAEGLSDVVQIGYFKLTGGRRFFRMAPIHYHFQLGGLAETQVVTRLWLVGMLGGLLGVALAGALCYAELASAWPREGVTLIATGSS